MNRTLIVQFCVVLALAGGSVWLGEVWRNEGKTFVQEKEKQGGIEKARLVLEADKKKAEIIESYEAEAREIRGLIEGRALADSETVRARGGRDRQQTENAVTRAVAFAIETTTGMQTIAERLAASSPDSSVARTMEAYVRRAAQAQGALRQLGWVQEFDCVKSRNTAVRIASALAMIPDSEVLGKH